MAKALQIGPNKVCDINREKVKCCQNSSING